MVANQSTATGDGCLRAFAASDGKLLWSTDQTADGIVILSPATIAGRYVFAIGLESAVDSSTGDLSLMALDITSGRPIWKTRLAGINNRPNGPQPWTSSEIELFQDQGAPALTDDSVLIAPGVGAVFAIDRFDGHVQWVHPYHALPIEENAARMFNTYRYGGKQLNAPFRGCRCCGGRTRRR